VQFVHHSRRERNAAKTVTDQATFADRGFHSHYERQTQRQACPACERPSADAEVEVTALPEPVQRLIVANLGAFVPRLCSRCAEIFERAERQFRAHTVVEEQNGLILPTYLRLDADQRFAGRGVVIAFLDSGFYAHPDLTTPRNRIIAYHSIVRDDASSLGTPDVASWHGMMTSVVACGNGALSQGLYRGLAPEAELVLVKISDAGRIPERNIRRGLEWVIANRDRYGIRVVNISAGGDREASYLHNALSKTVERAVRAGLVVVCAVGNAGMQPNHPVYPPASAPSCIAVGGLDDQNSTDRARRGMYRSSYGPTIDGLQKPEVIAPGIWVAAPILPHTPTAAEAELYATLDQASDEELRAIIERNAEVDKELFEARTLPAYLLRQLITIKLREGNVINEHYKYVDGTSFAAPIVSSLVACMLEANPALTPQQVKRILIDTAERVPTVEVDRQGWGVIVPRRAVEMALALR